MAVHTKLSCELNNSKIKPRHIQSESVNSSSTLDLCIAGVGIIVMAILLGVGIVELISTVYSVYE